MNSENTKKLNEALDRLGAAYESAKENVFGLSVLENEIDQREDLLNDLRDMRDMAATTMRELYKDHNIKCIMEPAPIDVKQIVLNASRL